jgi:hypothetical protein
MKRRAKILLVSGVKPIQPMAKAGVAPEEVLKGLQNLHFTRCIIICLKDLDDMLQGAQSCERQTWIDPQDRADRKWISICRETCE